MSAHFAPDYGHRVYCSCAEHQVEVDIIGSEFEYSSMTKLKDARKDMGTGPFNVSGGIGQPSGNCRPRAHGALSAWKGVS